MKYVVARIDEGKNASEIIKDVNIAQAIHWLQVAWKDISKETILHCFQKCGFEKSECHSVSGEGEVDEEFESLLAQLRQDDDITVEYFITFDDNLTTSIGQINTDMVDWRQQAWEDAIQEVLPDVSAIQSEAKLFQTTMMTTMKRTPHPNNNFLPNKLCKMMSYYDSRSLKIMKVSPH